MPAWMTDFTADQALATYAASLLFGGIVAFAVAFLRSLRV